jgi:hypothetical protein
MKNRYARANPFGLIARHTNRASRPGFIRGRIRSANLATAKRFFK